MHAPVASPGLWEHRARRGRQLAEPAGIAHGPHDPGTLPAGSTTIGPPSERVVEATEHARTAAGHAVTISRLEVSPADGWYSVDAGGPALDVVRWIRLLEQHAFRNNGLVRETALIGRSPESIHAQATVIFLPADARVERLGILPDNAAESGAGADAAALRMLADRWRQQAAGGSESARARRSAPPADAGHEATDAVGSDDRFETEPWRSAGEIRIGDRVSEVFVRATSVRIREHPTTPGEIETR
ncbi:MAG: hypothetical protein ACOC1U_07950 [Spirochaetota bacterium]